MDRLIGNPASVCHIAHGASSYPSLFKRVLKNPTEEINPKDAFPLEGRLFIPKRGTFMANVNVLKELTECVKAVRIMPSAQKPIEKNADNS